MSQPFVGEIRMFAGNFAPAGWAFCDGALIAISENDTLFSLIGTTYGGDGQNTFGLPDLRGRVPVHVGTGSGLTTRNWGEKAGVESASLTTAQLPVHHHAAQASSASGTQNSPAGGLWAQSSLNQYVAGGTPQNMNAANIPSSGGGNQSHDNMMPTLVVSYIIALVGIYPSRN